MWDVASGAGFAHYMRVVLPSRYVAFNCNTVVVRAIFNQKVYKQVIRLTSYRKFMLKLVANVLTDAGLATKPARKR